MATKNETSSSSSSKKFPSPGQTMRGNGRELVQVWVMPEVKKAFKAKAKERGEREAMTIRKALGAAAEKWTNAETGSLQVLDELESGRKRHEKLVKAKIAGRTGDKTPAKIHARKQEQAVKMRAGKGKGKVKGKVAATAAVKVKAKAKPAKAAKPSKAVKPIAAKSVPSKGDKSVKKTDSKPVVAKSSKRPTTKSSRPKPLATVLPAPIAAPVTAQEQGGASEAVV